MALLIPRTVHRLWFGTKRMPADYIAYGRAWERLGYELHTWTEADLGPLVNGGIWDEIGRNGVNVGGGNPAVGLAVQRADVVAYELAYVFGGIVANCDIEPLRPLDDMLYGVEAFAVREQGPWISNALIGSVPGHPFWQAVIARLPQRYRLAAGRPMNEQTGPHLLTEVAASRDDLAVLPEWVAMPYLYGEMHKEGRPDLWDTPDAPYCEHHWGHQHPELLED